MTTIVLLNARANGGEGLRRWERVRPLLESSRLGRGSRIVLDPGDLARALRNGSAGGGALVVAAGGDGTVNLVMNEIMDLDAERRRHVILGAVGLGSSNDFHKPHDHARVLDGSVHVRLETAGSYLHNVGEVEFEDEKGEKKRRYFVLNCSLGIIAQANAFFNRGNRLLDVLKRRFVPGAIYYAALKTILAAPDVPAEIAVAGETLSAAVTNLSVVINPHFSGNLRYDFAVDGRSGNFGVALCEGMGVPRRLRTLASLANGRFRDLPGTKTWLAADLRVSTALPTAFEMDGEVFPARGIRIRLLREKVRVCP